MIIDVHTLLIKIKCHGQLIYWPNSGGHTTRYGEIDYWLCTTECSFC